MINKVVCFTIANLLLFFDLIIVLIAEQTLFGEEPLHQLKLILHFEHCYLYSMFI